MFYLISSWQQFQDDLQERGPAVLLIILLATVAYALFRRIFPHVLRAAILRGKAVPDEEIERRIDTLAGVGNRTASLVAVVLATVTSLPELGVNITAIVAGFSITGLAIALGSQALVRDAVNGIFLLAEDQYRKGDFIRIADVRGTVEDFTLRRTIIRDDDGVLHSVPNGAISVVSNFTRDFARINLPVDILYLEDLPKAVRTIDRIGKELAADGGYGKLLLEAPAAGRVEAIGDKGVTISVSGRARPAARWDVASELRRRLAEALVREGVRVPFPIPPVAAQAPSAPGQPTASSSREG